MQAGLYPAEGSLTDTVKLLLMPPQSSAAGSQQVEAGVMVVSSVATDAWPCYLSWS